MSLNEVKKMKQGMSYSCKEKTIIINVFKYFKQIYPDKCVTELVRRTSKATGCSEKSIFQFRKEEASATGFREPSKTKIRKNPNINSRDMKYNSETRQAIRSIVYDLKYRNIVPSLSTILKQVNQDARLPNLSLMTLRRLLFDMGFCYEKDGNKSILVDKNAEEPKHVPVPNQQAAPPSNNPAMIDPNQSRFMPVQSAVNPVNNNMQYKYDMLQMSQNVPANQQNIVPDHMHVPPDQNQRTLTIHLSAQDHLPMPPPPIHPPHNMMMFNNHRDYPGPVQHQQMNVNMDMHYKYDFPHAPWVSHSNSLVKKE